MSQLGAIDLTRMLATMSDADHIAAAELLPFVYDELRALAGGLLDEQRPGHTLQGTALVHEAYLRLAGEGRRRWESRAHFFRVAAIAMRHILVNHARDKARQKRGGEFKRVPLDDALALFQENAAEMVLLDDCLTRLDGFDSRCARVVELRFFAGLSVADTAETLGVSERTVEKDWQVARLWLAREMKSESDP